MEQEEPERLREAAEKSQTAAILQGALRLRVNSLRTWALLPTACPLTIPDAAYRLHIGERNLRRLLEEPQWKGRLVERNHEVGIYYKFIPLLPEMVVDLAEWLAGQSTQTGTIQTGTISAGLGGGRMTA